MSAVLLDDTICALGSPAGPAMRLLLRLSGPRSFEIASRLQRAPMVVGASRRRLCFAGLEVDAWVYAFAAPRSYTGQDVVELHLPGNPLLGRLAMEELLRQGARQAGPGEFTARAYFSGRLSLAEAEGVAATIAARSEEEVAAARQLLAGELARRLGAILEQLAETLALTEVGIDFSEEDVTFLSSEQTYARLDAIDAALTGLISTSARFERLSHEAVFVLVGRPNAGKSTLLNALCGHERAVVSEIAGTTRDALSAEVMLERGLVRLIDVAGLDESDAAGEIDRQMRQRARRTLEQADFVILVREFGDARPPLELPRRPDITVHSKSDLSPDPQHSALSTQYLPLSARTGHNLDMLRHRMGELAHGGGGAASALALNARHLAALDDARAALSRARAAVDTAGPEVLALELREALNALGNILGQVTPDDVLGRIFGSFCIGK